MTWIETFSLLLPLSALLTAAVQWVRRRAARYGFLSSLMALIVAQRAWALKAGETQASDPMATALELLVGVACIAAVVAFEHRGGASAGDRQSPHEQANSTPRDALQLGLASAGIASWTWSLESGEVKWSDHTESVLHLASGTFAGTYEAYRSLVHPADLQALDEALDNALQQGGTYDVEHRIQTPFDEVRWLESKGLVSCDRQGKPIRVAGVVIDITARRGAEVALRQNESRLRTLMAMTPIILFAVDHEGRFTLSEGRQLARLGLAPGEIVGQSVFRLYGEYPEIVRGMRQALAGESTAWTASVDGVVFDTRVMPLRDAAGAIKGAIGVAVDVTEHRRAEADLRASQETFAKAFACSPDAIMITSIPEGRVLEVNGGFTRVTGHGRDEVIGKLTTDLDMWNDAGDRDRLLEQIEREGRVYNFQARFRSQQGGLRWCRIDAELIELEGETRLLSVTRDETERLEAEAELHASRERLRLAIAAARLGVWSRQAESDHLEWDERMCEIFGCSPGVVHDSRSFIERVHDEDRTRVQGAIRQALKGPDDYEIRYRLVRDDGEERTVLSLGAVERDPSTRRALRMTGICLDITEQQQNETERENVMRELESKNAELERFTYTVSHDLKSPLITIRGFLGMLAKDVASGDQERLEADLQRIGRATDTMERLLDELLHLSRVGRVVDPSQEVSLTDIVCEAVERVAGNLEKRGVTVEVAAELPVVFGDRIRLLEVFQNLVDNAAKFMGDQQDPRIEIGVGETTATHVECYVRDNGIGIDERYSEKIFGLFERLDLSIDGTGIGLALVRRIVDYHNGRIWAESPGLGQGSTFRFILPRLAEAVRDHPVSHAS